MATPGTGVVDRTGDGIHLAALLRRQPRGNQRTAGDAGLHHQHAQGQATDDSIAPGEVFRTRRGVQRELGNHRAALVDHGPGQGPVPLWIKFPASAQHAHGAPANIQGRLMGSAIDAQGQTAGDDKTGTGQAAGKGPGGVQPRSRCATAAHHRQLRPFENRGVAGHEQQRRRILELRQQGRVAGLVPHQQMLGLAIYPGQCATGAVAHLGAAPGLAAGRRQVQGTPGTGRGTECFRSATECLKQALKTHRPEFGQDVQAQSSFQFCRGNAAAHRVRHGSSLIVRAPA